MATERKHSPAMERITSADIEQMRANGFDRSTIAEAEAWLAQWRRAADELIPLVQHAFAGVELGEGIGLRESHGMDDYAGPEELKRLRAADEKHDWRKIPAELLLQCSEAPSFLDAKGMRFHAPAFIVAELKGDYERDFIGRLADGSYIASEFPSLLTEEQRKAIIECIRFCFYCSDAERYKAAIARFGGPA